MIKLSNKDLDKLESGEFFTREHLNTYTKKQLVEIMLMMQTAIDTLANAIKQDRSRQSWIERIKEIFR